MKSDKYSLKLAHMEMNRGMELSESVGFGLLFGWTSGAQTSKWQ